MTAISSCYGRGSTPFGQLGPYYDSLGHRGKDYDARAGDPVIAYTDMIIVIVGHSDGLGTVVGASFTNGTAHAGWAHLRNVRSFINGFVPKGAQFAEVAGAGDDPGDLWSGPHIHTTISRESAYAAAYGIRPLVDPAPVIADVIVRGSASSGTITPIEVDDMTPEQAAQLIRVEQKLDAQHALESNLLIRNKDTGSVVIANATTGLWYGLPNWAYLALAIKLNLLPAGTRPQDALDIPANEYGWLQARCADVRGAKETADRVDAALADDFAKLFPTTADTAIPQA